MKYVVLTQTQLLLMTLLMAVLASVFNCCYNLYMDYRMLPMVYKDAAGTCLKVENLENGQAFNCNDVNVTLRRYKTAK